MFIIDRFEGGWAVIEFNRHTFNLPRHLLPTEAKGGDVIKITITVDQKATQKQKKKADSLLDNFFDK